MRLLNPELMQLIADNFGSKDDCDAALLYCFAAEYNIATTLYRWGNFKDDKDEAKYRILLTAADPNGGSFNQCTRCRYPLFAEDADESLYDTWYKLVFKSPKMSQHKNKLNNNPAGRQAFQALQEGIKNFDLSRFSDATINYYVKTGQYAIALPRFIAELGKAWYESYEEERSKMI